MQSVVVLKSSPSHSCVGTEKQSLFLCGLCCSLAQYPTGGSHISLGGCGGREAELERLKVLPAF